MWSSLSKVVALALVGVAALAPSAKAAYTTIDLSSFANNNLQLGEGSYPTGISNGNQGLVVPFAISGTNGTMNSYISPSANVSATLDLTGYGLSGQTTFYALLNNIYGNAGTDEYDITISTVQGPSVTFTSIGGVDTRDYNQNVYTNTLAPTTLTWFSNGSGQRLDLRQFSLPTALSADTVSGFTIAQNNNGDFAVLSGLTFSTVAGIVPVPEPASLALLSTALLFVVRRRR